MTRRACRDSNRNETYTYDAADRVASLTRGIAGSQSWNLDKLGNWNSVTTDSATQNRDHSPLTPGPQNGLNEIVDLKDASNTVTDNLSYDDAGNLTAITPVSGTARNFTWDANSRLKNWAKGATSIDYQYDAYGRRVSDGERRYVYGAGWRVAEERDLSNPQTDITDGSLVAMPLLKTLVYGNYLDEVVQYDAKINPSYNTAPTSNWDGRGDSGYDASWTDGKTGEQVYSRTYHIHCDQIYSAKALTNSAGDLSEYYDYTAYGTPTVYKAAGTDGNWFTTDDVVSTDGAGNPKSNFKNDHLYTEQRWDIGPGIAYFKQRYFDSNLGRFLCRWKMVKDCYNSFDYQMDDPIYYNDPLGDPDTQVSVSVGNTTETWVYEPDRNGWRNQANGDRYFANSGVYSPSNPGTAGSFYVSPAFKAKFSNAVASLKKVPIDIKVEDYNQYRNIVNEVGSLNADILAKSIPDMNNKIAAMMKKCQEQNGAPCYIRHLTISGHGASGDVSVGAGQGAKKQLPNGGLYRPEGITPEDESLTSSTVYMLLPIKQYFQDDSDVTLDTCHTGQDTIFLMDLSGMLGGIRVNAYTGSRHLYGNTEAENGPVTVKADPMWAQSHEVYVAPGYSPPAPSPIVGKGK